MIFSPLGLLAPGLVWAAEDGSGAAGSPPDPAPAAPAAAAYAPAPEGEAAPAAPESAAAPAPAAPAAQTPPERPATPDWRERRIAKLTAQLHEAREKLGAAASAPPPAAAPAPTDELINRRAEALAREMEATRAFNERCNAAADAGRSAFGEAEFNSRVAALHKVYDPADPGQVAAYNLMLEAAIETGQGPALLHRLGGDLNEAARVLALPPVKMALELAKLAVPRDPAPSAAPKPITPIGNRGASNERIRPDDPERADTLSTAEWIRRREEQVRAAAQ